MGMEYFPAFLDLHDHPCLVVGGSSHSAAKARLLLAAGARVTVVDPAPSSDVITLVAAGALVEPRNFRDADVKGCTAIISATGDRALDARVAETARRVGVPVNVVDNAELSTFVVPAIVDRDPIVVAIASGGCAPALARWVRERIEAMLPARLGQLARFTANSRGRVKALLPDVRARRRFWARFFDGPVARKLLEGDPGAEEQDILELVNGLEDSNHAGSVAIVGVGPGDPDLLTLKALRRLQNADVVVYDRLVGDKILDLARREAERIYVGKAAGDHALSQCGINSLLAEWARAGFSVVRLKGGDPMIFGRGGEEYDYLSERGIDVSIVPGITAATAASSSLAVPLTHREIAQAVTLVTGHRRAGGEDINWDALASLDHTIVVYMGLANAAEISRRLIGGGLEPLTPVAVVEKACLPGERVLSADLAHLPALAGGYEVEGPALIIIGEVAASAAACRKLSRGAGLEEVAA